MNVFATETDQKDSFLFIGNELILDFLNTRPVRDGEEVELIPDASALLRWFHAVDLLSSRDSARLLKWDQSRSQRLWKKMTRLRERLRREVLHWEQGGALRSSILLELNELLAKHPMLSRLKANGTGLLIEPYFKAVQPDDLFAPLAYSAATLFANADRNRVRQCQNCVLHFYDTSKKGTRRWCSMQLCGNRLKVAAYAARQWRLSSNEQLRR